MARLFPPWVGLLLVAVVAAPLSAHSSPELTRLVLPAELCLSAAPIEQALLDDLLDGQLDDHTLLEAGLIAGGAQEQVVRKCTARLERLIASWRANDELAGSPRQRAETLFQLMHAELLTGSYRAQQSDVAIAIQDGVYNCVSATLLWQYLAAEFDVPAIARQLPGHLQSVLVLDEARILVEPTCPRWFSLVDERGRLRSGATELETAAANAAAGEGRDLDDAALIASVYYNRGLALLADRRHAAALLATYHAHRLDPGNRAARANLLAILNNWALDLAEEGQTARARALLERGAAMAPDHKTFQLNLGALQ